jgi:hypothetical protein
MKRFRFFFFYFFYSLLTATNGWMDQQQRFIQDLRLTDSIQLLSSLSISPLPSAAAALMLHSWLLLLLLSTSFRRSFFEKSFDAKLYSNQQERSREEEFWPEDLLVRNLSWSAKWHNNCNWGDIPSRINDGSVAWKLIGLQPTQPPEKKKKRDWGDCM